MTSKSCISIEGLSVSYGELRALRNVYLEIAAGDIHGIIGPNGAGKSTLFKAILGLQEPDSGSVSIWGQELDEVRKRVAYIPQKDEVDWEFPATVMDITLMGRYPHKRFFERIGDEDVSIAMQMLDKLGIADLKDRQIGQLSGGQQQRVFIARAMAQEPDLMLLDEPFVGVDATTESTIIKVLRDLSDQGKTFLVVHHDLSKVDDYFDQVILLNRRIIAAGPVASTFIPENIKKAYGSQSAILHKT